MIEKISAWLVDRFTGRNAKNFAVKNKVFTKANIMTIFGIKGTFIYLALFVGGIWPWMIPIVFPLCVLTDCLDGYLADLFNEHSAWGKILDPVRDRLLSFAGFFNIWFVIGSSVVFPLAVSAFLELYLWARWAYYFFAHGKNLEVHAVGKIRSAVQWVLIELFLIQQYWIGELYLSAEIISWAIFFAGVVAFFFYISRRA